MYITCPERVLLIDPSTGKWECAELEAYHSCYAVYSFPSGRRVLIYVGLCNGLRRC